MTEQQKTFDKTSTTEWEEHKSDHFKDFFFDHTDLTKRIEPIPSSYDKYSNGNLVQTLNGRILDWNEHSVKVEVLVNKEEGLFEIRTFTSDVFYDTDLLNHHQLIRIFTYVKRKEIRVRIEDGTHFVSRDLFPTEDLLTNLKSDLFQFK